MDEPYMGEIRPIGISYAPRNWAFCNGQLLSINQYQALFSLLGTQFGGNGVTTFALPDLRGRIPVGTGQLPGGGPYVQGQLAGFESVTLQTAQMPQHAHLFKGTLQTTTSQDEPGPGNQLPATGTLSQYSSGPADTAMAATVTGTTTSGGGSQPHENRQPYTALNYVIALLGIYPTRP